MGFWSNMMQTAQAAFWTVRRVFDDPSSQDREQAFNLRLSEYNLLWAYYNNSMFEKIAYPLASYQAFNRWNVPWGIYKQNYQLYRNIRMIYNPTRRLVEFYAGQIYPGVLSEDGLALPDGIPLAIPFSKDTEPALKSAIAQLWQWSNWQAKKALQVRYGAALGSTLVEVVDDVAHGKVTLDVTWPGLLSNLDLDKAGNVKRYILEYPAVDDDGQYIYRKEVDSESLRYFRDGQPFDYGNGAIVENVYGFAPAVWIKHRDAGGIHGSPEISGDIGKIDELNGLASHVHDQIHKVIGAPVVMWSAGNIQKLFDTAKRGPTNEFEAPPAEQEQVLLLKGPQGGSVDSLAGNLSLSESGEYIDRLLVQLEKDHPELTFYEQLRSMSQVTGPAVSRLIGDVYNKVLEVQASYDTASISLFRMAVAIAGFRANSGAWGALNRQQQKFVPFNLDSYARGDLDMAIAPRPLVVPTKQEVYSEKQAMWQGVQFASAAGVPPEVVLRDEGWSDEQLNQLGADKIAAIQRDQLMAQEDTIPAHVQ